MSSSTGEWSFQRNFGLQWRGWGLNNRKKMAGRSSCCWCIADRNQDSLHTSQSGNLSVSSSLVDLYLLSCCWQRLLISMANLAYARWAGAAEQETLMQYKPPARTLATKNIVHLRTPRTTFLSLMITPMLKTWSHKGWSPTWPRERRKCRSSCEWGGRLLCPRGTPQWSNNNKPRTCT